MAAEPGSDQSTVSTSHWMVMRPSDRASDTTWLLTSVVGFATSIAPIGVLWKTTGLATARYDRVVPGGITQDLNPGGLARLGSLLEFVDRRFPELVEIYDNTASLQDRTVATGYLSPTLARAFGAGGYVGRASGRAFDARKAVRYPPYDVLEFEAPVRDDADVNARVWIRVREIEQSLKLIGQLLELLPQGPVRTDSGKEPRAGEGLGLVESFRGDVLVYVRISEDGLIERCHFVFGPRPLRPRHAQASPKKSRKPPGNRSCAQARRCGACRACGRT